MIQFLKNTFSGKKQKALKNQNRTFKKFPSRLKDFDDTYKAVVRELAKR